jgi:broad specificity phosphatase PhoE
MPELILIRHSLPEIVPTVSANQWSLSEAGRQRCGPLAEKLAFFHPDVVVTSIEPKAIETGRIVAQHLKAPLETAEGLHEHERPEATFGSMEQFEAAVARLFEQPGRLVFGAETADQAHQRFAQAVTATIGRYPYQSVAIVTHGTVMALFVSRMVGLEPLLLWKRLGLPAFVVLSLPSFGLVAVVEGAGVED